MSLRVDHSPMFRSSRLLLATALLALGLAAGAWAQTIMDPSGTSGGPIVLRQSGSATEPERSPSAQDRDGVDSRDTSRTDDTRDRRDARDRDGDRLDDRERRRDDLRRPRRIGRDGLPLPPLQRGGGDFDAFVQRLAEPIEIRRFGADLMTDRDRSNAMGEPSPLVPPDYLVSSGDELLLTLWGSVVADLRLNVDRSGRISVPRVGPVMVAGVRYADLNEVIRSRVAQVFRNFDVSVGLGRLRGLRVYVTGFVNRPGAYSVSSLSTVAHALLKAGGPSTAGSFRQIQLRRGGAKVSDFDLYDLLLQGNAGADRLLQADDVVHVGPVGPQVALIGSVNNPAIFELVPGETVADVLRMAGGFTAVADRSRLAVERLDDRSSVRIAQLSLPAQNATPLSNGDVLRAFSAVDAALPVERQNKRVRVEGEVLRPGEYVLPPSSSIADALKAAGGLTPAAYVFGTEFSRESVRLTQQDNYDRALRDLETEFTRAASTQRTTTADEAAAATARASSTTRLVERLRAIRPNGRVVLQMQPDSRELPDLALEDGDRLYIPPQPTTVGVFGSVFNAGSYLYGNGRSAQDYVRLAGGPTKGADPGSAFVIRANGSVVSSRQKGNWLLDGSLAGVEAQAGDTVFVPEEIDKTTWVQHAKDWTQVIFQLGLGVAAFNAVR